MGRAFGEQIAVLDGLDSFGEVGSTIDYDTSESDGRIGQARADASLYSQVLARGPAGIIATARRNVIDASAGANYSGGSSYAARLPLLPSTVGLADVPGVLPPRYGVIDPSGGANYTGGADWVPGLPLTVSNAGLAASLISGGYGRDGLGRSSEGYGRVGLGQPMGGADDDLASAFASVEDGRIGQQPPRVDQYARMIEPNVLVKTRVIDPSGGANYSGGSSYAPGIPLISSNSGLAGLDAMSDKTLKTAAAKLRRRGMRVNTDALQKNVGQKPLQRLKNRVARSMRVWSTMTPAQQAQAKQDAIALGKVRSARAGLVRASRSA